MYEMQGPHVAGQSADLPIPRRARVLPGPPPCSQSLRGARSPGSRTTLGVAPAGDCRSGGEGISTASSDGPQGNSLIFLGIFRPPQKVDCYPPMRTLIHRISTPMSTRVST